MEEPLYDVVWWVYVVSLILLIGTSGAIYTFLLRRNYIGLRKNYYALKRQSTIDDTYKQNVLSKLYTEFHSIAIKNKIPSDGEWDRLTQSIRRIYPNFEYKLVYYHHLNETEFKVSMLIKLELIPKDIALLLCKSKEAVSSIRRRLCQRILNSDKPSPKSWDEYVKSL